jgi:guanylate kinase
MGKLTVFVGPVGAGKTSIAGELIARDPLHTRMVKSRTTRARRANDLPDEYEYYPSDAAFDEMLAYEDVLWQTPHAVVRYATLARDVREALAHEGCGIMILVPSILALLREFLAREQKANNLQLIFVLPPAPDVVMQRLLLRGGMTRDAILARQLSEQHWESEARMSPHPYVFIENTGTVEEAVDKLLNLLSYDTRPA